MPVRTASRIIAILFFYTAGVSRAQDFTAEEIARIKHIESISSIGDFSAFSQEAKNDVDSAVAWLNIFETAPEFQQHKVWVYYNRGRLNLLSDHFEQSRLDLENAINLDSMNYDVMDRICVLSSHLKNYTKRKHFINRGVRSCKAVLSKDSSKAVDWYCYSEFLDLQSQYNATNTLEKRRYALMKATQLDSTNADYWYKRSYTFTDNAEIRIRFLNKALLYEEHWLYRNHIMSALAPDYKGTKKSIEYVTLCIDLYKEKYPTQTWYIKELYERRARYYKDIGNTQLKNADLKAASEIK